MHWISRTAILRGVAKSARAVTKGERGKVSMRCQDMWDERLKTDKRNYGRSKVSLRQIATWMTREPRSRGGGAPHTTTKQNADEL